MNPQKLSDAAKLNLVVTKLTKSAIQQVSDILFAPPETRKYLTMKERLLEVYEESETRKLQKLIGEMELGDQRPSQLLRRMRDLAREKVPDDTLRLMWQSHLPTAVRAVLLVTDSKSLDVLATIADKVLESTGGTTAIEEVKEVELHGKEIRKAESGLSEASQILCELAKINLRLTGLGRGRDRQRDGSSRRARFVSKDGKTFGKRRSANWLCFYHYRYRNNATRCVKLCNWGSAQAKPAGNQK